MCKNDLDINDISDSATVSEFISSSSSVNLFVCSVNKQGVVVHKQVSAFFDAAHSMSSEVVDFHVLFSPGFLMQ